ncbi:MAG: hypothetical protein U0871_25935 [Gemmataceae bacterium]
MSVARLVPHAAVGPGLFVAAAAAYLGLTATAGRFPHIDEVAYKAAGFHLAADGRWHAPELIGLIPAAVPVEEFWAGYPPVYTLAFAAAVWAAGMGWRTAALFDAVIHVGLAATAVWFTARITPAGRRAWAVGLAALAVGTVGRPDELGMTFGLIGLARLRTADSLWAVVRAGGWLGLAAATAPGAAVVHGLIGAIAVGRADARRVGVWGVIGAAVGLASLAPYELLHPGAVGQFFVHAQSYGRGWADGFAQAWRFGKHPLLMAVGLCLAAGLTAQTAGPGRAWAAGGIAGVLIVLATSPGRVTYLWYAGPVLIAAVAGWPTRAAVGVAVTAVGIGAVPTGVQTLALLTLPAGQGWAVNAAAVREAVPAGAVVVADEHWWSLAGHARVLDAHFARPPDWDRVDYGVLTGNGSGAAGQPRLPTSAALQTELAARFVVRSDTLNGRPLRVAGVRLTNSGYGFGAVVWARAGPPP